MLNKEQTIAEMKERHDISDAAAKLRFKKMKQAVIETHRKYPGIIKAIELGVQVSLKVAGAIHEAGSWIARGWRSIFGWGNNIDDNMFMSDLFWLHLNLPNF